MLCADEESMKGVYDHLTKHELVQVVEIISDSLKIGSDKELQDILCRIRNLVPCDSIVSCLGRLNTTNQFQDLIKVVNVSYSTDWVKLYLERGYAAVDPVLQTHFAQFKTQVWSKTYQGADSPQEKAFIKQAQEFGLIQGVTGGVACEHSRTASIFSFAGKSMGEHIRHFAVLECLMPHIHLGLIRLAFSPCIDLRSLTAREREILVWLKEGKTNWEISKILNISERTVKFHVKNILIKLHASNRGHAVALALEAGLMEL